VSEKTSEILTVHSLKNVLNLEGKGNQPILADELSRDNIDEFDAENPDIRSHHNW
jgi:hypothetical protein